MLAVCAAGGLVPTRAGASLIQTAVCDVFDVARARGLHQHPPSSGPRSQLIQIASYLEAFLRSAVVPRITKPHQGATPPHPRRSTRNSRLPTWERQSGAREGSQNARPLSQTGEAAARSPHDVSAFLLDALQAFGGVAGDAKAVAGVGRTVLAVCEPKIELPDLFNPAV
jgi:hypothetical protein